MTDLFGNVINFFPADEIKTPDFSTFVCFDIETTGLARDSHIIEIGAVKVLDGKITDSFCEFVNPGVHIPSQITGITGITDEMVKDAENIQAVLKRFKDFAAGYILVGHNAISFDCAIMRHWADIHEIMIDNKVFDTLRYARYRCEETKALKSRQLSSLCAHFGIVSDTYHRAAADAEITAKLYFELQQTN